MKKLFLGLTLILLLIFSLDKVTALSYQVKDLAPSDCQQAHDPFISGSSDKVVFVCFIDRFLPIMGVYINNSDGLNLKRLVVTPSGRSAFGPSISADGSKIVFYASIERGAWDIYTINSDGSNFKRLTPDEFFRGDVFPVISGDGSKIAFNRNIDGKIYPHIMNYDGTNVIKLAEIESADRPSISHDGSTVVFRGQSLSYIVNSNGANLRQIPHSDNLTFNPVISGDGSKVTFISNTSPRKVFITNIDGNNFKEVVSGVNYGLSINFDGSKIVVDEASLTGGFIRLVDITKNSIQNLEMGSSPHMNYSASVIVLNSGLESDAAVKSVSIIPLPPQFYSEIQNAPNWLRLRATPGSIGKPENDVVKTLPGTWILKVLSTTDVSGDNVDLDGFRWYKVEDVTDNTTGWVAARSLSDGTVHLDYNPNLQIDFENKAAVQLDTPEKRKPTILDAVNTYYNAPTTDNSLYGGGGGRDGNNNFQTFIQGAQFPKELALAITTQESGPSFNNEICSDARDGGIGIMQITSNDLKGLGSGLDNFPHKNDCRSTTESLSKYYSNASQGIYANIKDGFRTLQEKYRLVGRTQAVGTTSDLEMKAISTVYRYNQGSPYRVQAVYEIWNGKDNTYVWNQYLHYLYPSQAQADVWTEKVRSACTALITFAGCLNKTENLKLTTSAFYLRDVGNKLKSSPFGQLYTNSELGDKLISANNSRIILFLRSPAELQAINSLGETTGSVTGDIKQEIPNALYETEKGLLTIFFPQENYTYRVRGTASGEYGLSADFFNNESITVFDARNIPISPREIHDYTLDWDKMSRCERGATKINIDREGDGIIDEVIQGDCKVFDIELPQIFLAPLEAEYVLGNSVPFEFSATDAVSGIASLTATLNGTPVAPGEPIVLSQAGINTILIVAEDRAGNIATLTKTFEVIIGASIEIKPETLQKGSGGKHITVRIMLPLPYTAKDINAATLKINGVVSPLNKPVEFETEDGVTILKVKFPRSEVQTITAVGQNEIVVTGKLANGLTFKGSDTVTVIEKPPSGSLLGNYYLLAMIAGGIALGRLLIWVL